MIVNFYERRRFPVIVGTLSVRHRGAVRSFHFWIAHNPSIVEVDGASAPVTVSPQDTFNFMTTKSQEHKSYM
jgi:hypothetical protein